MATNEICWSGEGIQTRKAWFVSVWSIDRLKQDVFWVGLYPFFVEVFGEANLDIGSLKIGMSDAFEVLKHVERSG